MGLTCIIFQVLELSLNITKENFQKYVPLLKQCASSCTVYRNGAKAPE